MKLAILGTVGVPGRYGGFETLATNLVRAADSEIVENEQLTVYCSARAHPGREERFLGARLRYSRLSANGLQSILYDLATAFDAIIRGHNLLLFLGVSGAVGFPLIRALTSAKIVVNVDGVEWRRDKWKGIAKIFLRLSERLAVRFAHVVISDNEGISQYLASEYGAKSVIISYGGDHALTPSEPPTPKFMSEIPERFALALCRIEPENNVEMILLAFSEIDYPLVFVGNWSASEYGTSLRKKFGDIENMFLIDPIYDDCDLYSVRSRADVYIHGHSAGGTNPSLVEMMHFGVSVCAFDCIYNRYTTEGSAYYFGSALQLREVLSYSSRNPNGREMLKIARRKYVWKEVAAEYFSLLRSALFMQAHDRY